VDSFKNYTHRQEKVEQALPSDPQPRQQGDQIGQIFAQWVIVYFVQFLKYAVVDHNSGYFVSR
jgi:hypothetical protein